MQHYLVSQDEEAPQLRNREAAAQLAAPPITAAWFFQQNLRHVVLEPISWNDATQDQGRLCQEREGTGRGVGVASGDKYNNYLS